MNRVIDAVYENGAFRPVCPDAVSITDGQRVQITVEVDGEPEALRAAMNVYEGLAEEVVDEIERIALDRGRFFGNESAG